MRPRRMRLGYRRKRLLAGRAGQRFNEAEAHAPRIQRLALFLNLGAESLQ